MKITIKDIAKRCAVSVTTVSMVMNGKSDSIGKDTIERVRRTVAELQYQPNAVARSMITKRTHSIGLVLPDIRNPFFSDLAKGVEDYLNANGYGVFLCNTDSLMDKEDQYIRLLQARLSDGLIFTTQNTIESNPLFATFANQAYPFVLVERYVAEPCGVPGVYVDNRRAAEEICTYLIERGHRRIICISGPLNTTNARHRVEGYRTALERAGLSRHALVIEGNYRYRGGYEAVRSLAAGQIEGVTGVFASNDLMGYGAIEALAERGYSVPEDVSIVGFDGISFPSVLKPQLTSVYLAARQMGEKAAELLLAIIEKREPDTRRYACAHAIVEKQSVRAI